MFKSALYIWGKDLRQFIEQIIKKLKFIVRCEEQNAQTVCLKRRGETNYEMKGTSVDLNKEEDDHVLNI